MKLVYSLVLACLVLFSTAVNAENTKVFGEYIVKYSVLNSEQLSEQLIRRFNLKRSPTTGYVQIEVIPKKGGSSSMKISGQSNNMVSRAKLDFKEMRFRGNSMYFAEFKYKNRDICYFEVNLLPRGNSAPYRLKFSKSLNLK